MKYSSKMTSIIITGAENRSKRVETVETGLKMANRAENSRGATGKAVVSSKLLKPNGLHRDLTLGGTWANHVAQLALGRGLVRVAVRVSSRVTLTTRLLEVGYRAGLGFWAELELGLIFLDWAAIAFGCRPG